MMIVLILASWIGVSILFCLAVAVAAARRVPRHDSLPARVEIAPAPDTRFEPSVVHALAAA